MPGLVYACGVMLGTEQFAFGSAANMTMIAFGVVVCALGEANLVMKGLLQQLTALGFEVRMAPERASMLEDCSLLHVLPVIALGLLLF